MSTHLVLVEDHMSRAGSWSNLLPDERKRRAARAIQSRDVAELVELMDAHLTLRGKRGARVSDLTRAAYASDLRILLAAWSGVNLLRPSEDDAFLWVRRMEDAGLAASTVGRRLAAARRFYAALKWAGLDAASPFTQDVRPAEDPTPAWEKRQAYAEDDLERMLAVADPIAAAIIFLGAWAGLRAAEMLSLEWSEVNLSGRRLRVLEGKGGKSRTVPFGDRLARALLELRALDTAGVAERSARAAAGGAEGDRLYVLPFRSTMSARDRLNAVCHAAGVEPLGLHSLRHAAGTRWYRTFGRIEYVQRLLGHSNPKTTLIYAKMADDELAAAVAAIG